MKTDTAPRQSAKKKMHKLRKIPLVVLCYTVVIFAWLGICVFRFASDGIARQNGTLYQKTLHVQDFELENIEVLPGKRLLATTDDPQLILQVGEDFAVRSLRFSADFSSYGYEMCLYYTTKPGEPFSQNKRVWPVQQNDGSYAFTLPFGHIEALRLDPASAEVEMHFGLIVLNEQPTFGSYFNPGWGGFTALLTLPALLAALLGWLTDMFKHYSAVFAARRWLKNKKQALAAQAKQQEGNEL